MNHRRWKAVALAVHHRPVRDLGSGLPHFQYRYRSCCRRRRSTSRRSSVLVAAAASHSIVTLWTTMAGFALAVAFGIVLGIVVGWSRTIYRGLYPVMIGFNSIPKVAVVPILIMWFGIGEVPAILTAFLISFFPIVVNVATGLATMEPELEDVLRALGASKLDIMLKVGIPRTPALSVRLAQGRDHAGLRRHRGVGDHRRQCRSRLSDGAGRIELPDAAGVRRPARCWRSKASRCTRCSPISKRISPAGRSARP